MKQEYCEAGDYLCQMASDEEDYYKAAVSTAAY